MKIQKIQYLVALGIIIYAPNAVARPIQTAIVNVTQTAIVAPTINAGNGGSGGAGGVSAGGSAVGGASGSSGNGGSVIGIAAAGGGGLPGTGGTATTTGMAGSSGDSGAGGSATGGSAGTANGGSGGSGSAGNSTLIAPANIKFSNTVNVSQTYNEQSVPPVRGGGFNAPTPAFGGSNPAVVNTRGFGSRSVRFGR
jgi:hypothetical protein